MGLILLILVLQIDGCLYVFKSTADSVRHMTLIHEKRGSEAHPLGFVCTYKAGDDEDICGLKFDSQHYLTCHKNEAGHKIVRGKRTQEVNEDVTLIH